MSELLSFHNKPIIIDDSWKRDDIYEGVYPSGARVKDAYFSPEEPEEKCIKSNWRYLFKLSRRRFPWQFWCEIIAYRFGCAIGIDVPPAHIGYSRKYEQGVDTYAALIEWFYDYKKKRYVSGGQVMVQLIDNFDRDTGEEHNLETIRKFFSDCEAILTYWAKVLTFDTLIGNRDRHQDNWGFIAERSEKQSIESIMLSPAFDNGTALCYEILEQNIDRYEDTNRLGRYLTGRRAKHHMKWSLDERGQLSFYEFIKKFAMAFPQIRDIIAPYLSFTYQQVEEVLAPLVETVVAPECRLTQKRLDFILKLIVKRRDILEKTLEL